jgi:UDP-N-acetylmuramoyl-L-alanyl-D-glutamate--2,6-diaminopimelate ligase
MNIFGHLNIFMYPYSRTRLYKIYRHCRRAINIAQAIYAYYRYGSPAKGMRLIGVTGTDGKTTTATMIAGVLQQAGRRVGLITTVEAKINDASLDTGLHVSTPGPMQIYALLAKMRDAGVQDVVIETTSHGLDQRRVFGLKFDLGIITNLAPEHLDYHHTMEQYAAAKARLLKQSTLAMLNADDAIARNMKSMTQPTIFFGMAESAEVRAMKVHEQRDGLSFDLFYPDATEPISIELPMPGKFNVSNALAAASAALQLGVAPAVIAEGLQHINVAGRWQVIQTVPFTIIIDFAHTPQAFERALPVARELAHPHGKLIHVFGSAAQRDVAKRPMMGELSGKYADITVLTMEDPRHESMDAIQPMLAQGLTRAGKSEGDSWFRIDDRQAAITWAISQAKDDDVVLITGKGHEQSLSVGGQELPWDEVEAVKKALRKRGKTHDKQV